MLFSQATNGPAARTSPPAPRSGGGCSRTFRSPNFGLNYDPSHMIWQQMDYLQPIREFKDRLLPRPRQGRAHRPRRLDEVGILAHPSRIPHAQTPRPGRRELGPVLLRPHRRRLSRAGLRGSRRPGLRRFARGPKDQPQAERTPISGNFICRSQTVGTLTYTYRRHQRR